MDKSLEISHNFKDINTKLRVALLKINNSNFQIEDIMKLITKIGENKTGNVDIRIL